MKKIVKTNYGYMYEGYTYKQAYLLHNKYKFKQAVIGLDDSNELGMFLGLTDFLVDVECDEADKYEKLSAEMMTDTFDLYEAADGRLFDNEKEAAAYEEEIMSGENMLEKFARVVEVLRNNYHGQEFNDEIGKYYASIPQKYKSYYSKTIELVK